MKIRTLGLITGYLGIFIYLLTIFQGHNPFSSNLFYGLIGGFLLGYHSKNEVMEK